MTLPVLSLFAGMVLGVYSGTCALIFGVLGGLVPFLIITIKKVDLSGWFIGKLVLTGVSALGITITWFICFKSMNDRIVFWMPPLVFIAEVIFAATRKAGSLQKVCLVLSSPLYIYIGVLIDIVLYFSPAH